MGPKKCFLKKFYCIYEDNLKEILSPIVATTWQTIKSINEVSHPKGSLLDCPFRFERRSDMDLFISENELYK